jgi:uncharacterized cupin superfamily protein
MSAMPNVFDASFEYDDADPVGYRCGVAKVGEAAGGVAEIAKLYEMPPGRALCPYHYEYEEEWMLLLSGELTLRAPDGERRLQAGELVCFPAGPDGAHMVTNTGDEPARLLMWSTARVPAVAVYPDSDKIGVFVSNRDDNPLVAREDGHREYYDREP